MMQYYRISAELKAPLVVQQNRQSNSSENVNYLPGSSLRGALAALYLRAGGSPDEEAFRQLFIEAPVAFPNLLPASTSTVISKPFALTAVSCKRESGFTAEKRHGVSDLLAAKLKERKTRSISNENQCPFCGQDMKPIVGFWNGNATAPVRFWPSMLYQRHTGIDRTTGTVAESIFYIRQAMADYYKKPGSDEYESQHLTGDVYLNDRQLALLKPLLEKPVFAGTDRTSGMGELSLSVQDITPASPAFDIEAWDNAFRTKYAGIGGADLPDGKLFAITLESDAIIVDRFLRPVNQLDIDFAGVKRQMQITKAVTVRGWQSSWGLPKPDDIGFATGSVFLFSYSGDDLEGLKQYLNEMLIFGIGLRREEGFGRISVCNPFHTIQEVM